MKSGSLALTIRFEQTSLVLVARVAVDLDLFNLTPESGIGLDSLTEKTGASRKIVRKRGFR